MTYVAHDTQSETQAMVASRYFWIVCFEPRVGTAGRRAKGGRRGGNQFSRRQRQDWRPGPDRMRDSQNLYEGPSQIRRLPDTRPRFRAIRRRRASGVAAAQRYVHTQSDKGSDYRPYRRLEQKQMATVQGEGKKIRRQGCDGARPLARGRQQRGAGVVERHEGGHHRRKKLMGKV